MLSIQEVDRAFFKFSLKDKPASSSAYHLVWHVPGTPWVFTKILKPVAAQL